MITNRNGLKELKSKKKLLRAQLGEIRVVMHVH